MIRNLVFFLIFSACWLSAAAQQTSVPIIGLEQYRQRVERQNDTLYVVNFWATWCIPCVEELPSFGQLSEEMKGKPVKFLLMSLDAQNTAFKIPLFLQRQRIGIECYLFAGGDPNIWINKIEKKWEGSIPATLLYRKGKVLDFYEGQFANKMVLEHFITRKL